MNAAMNTQTTTVKITPAGILVPIIVILVGLALISGFVISIKNYQEFAAIAESVTGEVVGMEREVHEVRRDGRTRTNYVYSPVVSFTTKDDQSITFISAYASDPPAYRQGDMVEVLYNPAYPEDAEVRDLLNPFTNVMMIILAVVGGVVALFGVGLFKALNTKTVKAGASQVVRPEVAASSPISAV